VVAQKVVTKALGNGMRPGGGTGDLSWAACVTGSRLAEREDSLKDGGRPLARASTSRHWHWHWWPSRAALRDWLVAQSFLRRAPLGVHRQQRLSALALALALARPRKEARPGEQSLHVACRGLCPLEPRPESG
jgi:hypothetical protein